MTDYLDLKNVARILDRYLGGTDTVRDWGLLESALYRPQATVFGADAYPNVHDKATALLESLVRNHPLVDGNKRLGFLSVALFYRYNDMVLAFPDGATTDTFIRDVAQGKHDLPQIAALLAGWTKPLAD